MFNEYVPTTYDRVLGAVGYVLFAPVALARWFIPSILDEVEARDIIGLLLFNIFMIGIAVLLLSIVCHKFENRKRNVRDNDTK